MKYLFNFILLIFFLLNYSVYSQNDTRMDDFGNLSRYAESNKRLGLPEKDENRVVFMGNSITEFWGVIDSNFFKDKPYINRGISGQTSSQMLLRFRQDVIDLKPAVVVILAGTNDIAENTGPIELKDIFGNIVSMCELAGANKIKVILSSVLPANDFDWHPGMKPAEKILRLNRMIEDYCNKNGVTYLDYYSSMVDERKGLDKKYSDDGVHPTLAGYKVMEPLVEKGIEQALEKGKTQ